MMKTRTVVTRASREFADNPRVLSRAVSENPEGGIDFNPHRLGDPEFTIMFRVEEAGLDEPHVSQGDLVIADRRARPRDGGLIIAMINGEMVLRRYSISGGREVLCGGVDSGRRIEVTADGQVEILAAVVSVIPVTLE